MYVMVEGPKGSRYYPSTANKVFRNSLSAVVPALKAYDVLTTGCRTDDCSYCLDHNAYTLLFIKQMFLILGWEPSH